MAFRYPLAAPAERSRYLLAIVPEVTNPSKNVGEAGERGEGGEINAVFYGKVDGLSGVGMKVEERSSHGLNTEEKRDIEKALRVKVLQITKVLSDASDRVGRVRCVRLGRLGGYGTGMLRIF